MMTLIMILIKNTNTMSDFTTLKDQIKQSIKTNGNGAITGQVLQDTLVNIVDVQGSNISLFTNKSEANNVIKKLFIDTTNYIGDYSLDGLKIQVLAREVEGVTSGIRLVNDQGQIIATFWDSDFSAIREWTQNGIYCYIEYFWENMNPNSKIFNIQFTNEVFAEYNDPRKSRSTKEIENTLSLLNSMFFTQDSRMNSIIRKLFIDTSGYTGSYSLEGLYISQIAKKASGTTSGIRISNKNSEVIGNYWIGDGQDNDIIETIQNGIYCYAEYNWKQWIQNIYMVQKLNL